MPPRLYEMALALLLAVLGVAYASPLGLEMAIANVTRYATGDLFSIAGTDCGPTRCMEMSHGTALAAMGFGGGCMCQCRGHKPAFREDQKICVSRIDECVMASFGKGVQPQIPFVFLPLKGQIIYPSNEIVFTEVQDAICAVTSAQYLSPSGWMTLRDLVDNDVPFGLYRDEGSTYLQWRGSAAMHTRLEGRLVTAHVICSSSTATQLATSCAAFRVAGASYNALLDVRSIPFHSGEAVTSEPASQSQGLSVLESLAIGVCVLMLVFVYAAGIVFYIHYKKRQKKKEKDPELNLSNTLTTDNCSLSDTLDSRLNMDNIHMKTNPLLKLDMGSDFLNDATLSDVSERTEDTIDSSPTHKRQKFQKTNVSAVVHNYRKKPTRPRIRSTSTPERVNERFQRRSASPDTLERAPHSELSIVDCSVEDEPSDQPSLPSEGEPALRRKLYFNPVFFETEHLKHPPPAAIEFLTKIREVMSIAKDKMTTKRFIPILSDIPEEDLHHSIDLGWDIPCARRGRRFSAISLKRENSRRAVHCGGCPGCDSNDSREPKSTTLARSNSCKSCVSEDYKQKIVRKWLDEVPILPPMIKPMKSVAKVSGTPRNVEPKRKEENNQNLLTSVQNDNIENLNISHPVTSDSYKINGQDVETISKKENMHLQKTPTVISKTNNQTDNSMELITIQAAMTLKQEQSPTNRITRRVKKRLPPPPPPPFSPPDPPKITDEDFKLVPEDIKKKMEAVIRELNLCKRSEAEELERLRANCFSPKIVIPVVAADTPVYEEKESSNQKFLMDFDSLERGVQKKRRFSLATDQEIEKNDSNLQPISILSDRLSQSWRDMRKAVEINQLYAPTNSRHVSSENEITNNVFNEIFITNFEPMYNNIPKPGPLTIEVRGSPVEARRNVNEEFDPDTLDRKPKREQKRVDKILLKSGGSFKHKVDANGNEFYKRSSPETLRQRIGSLRQIYEAKTKVQNNKILPYYERRGSLPLGSDELPPGFMRSLKTPDLLRRNKELKDPKPPVPPTQRRNSEISPKQRRSTEVSPKFTNSTRESPVREQRRYSEDRDRFSAYSRTENLSTRRSSRRSVRTRSRRTDLRKLCKPEDSGYLSTDSNESKRRARYLMQMRPKSVMQSNSVPACPPPAPIKTVSLQLESDTDEMESLCDGRSESGGESIETDSVFFGNFDESKHMFAECMNSFEAQKKLSRSQEQIDSGFIGDTNIVLSCDSDSEHRSVISIIAGRDGRASVASISQTDDPSY